MAGPSAGAGTAELERVYRAEARRIRAALAARLGDVGLAEELVQDAFVEALEHWGLAGTPPNPGGWLHTTAWRKAVDRLRREETGRRKLALLARTDPWLAGPGLAGRGLAGQGPGQDPGGAAGDGDGFSALGPAAERDAAADSLLGLIFACSDPALSRDSQIALTLRAVCGLSTAEIAAAFLASPAAMSQRLTRAADTLRRAGAPVRVPDPDELPGRLGEALAAVYLMFNEGYLASAGRAPARRDLSGQAIELARLLHRLMPREPEVAGLLALMLLHESRAATRFDGWGRMVRLADQDRSRWDARLIAEATGLLDRALALRRPGRYQVQAAIAALHAEAASYAQTDWRQIRLLYDGLIRFEPSPVVRLNRAVATRYAVGPGAALAEVEAIAPELDGYRLLHAVRAELLAELGRPEEARAANERALELAGNPAERELLTRRLSV